MTIEAVRARIVAIVQGRGADGSLGAAAQARATTLERFRITSTPDLLTLDAPAFDRATHVTIDGLNDPIPRNVQSPVRSERATITITVGYAAADALWPMVHGEADDAAKRAAVAQWKSRAADDVSMLDRALTWYELTSNDTSPVIERVAPMGETIATNNNNGRELIVRRYELWTEATQP